MSDAFLHLLLEDDRVVRNIESFQEYIPEELEWLSGISWFTWERLAALIGDDEDPTFLLGDVLKTGMTSTALVDSKVNKVTTEVPYHL